MKKNEIKRKMRRLWNKRPSQKKQDEKELRAQINALGTDEFYFLLEYHLPKRWLGKKA